MNYTVFRNGKIAGSPTSSVESVMSILKSLGVKGIKDKNKFERLLRKTDEFVGIGGSKVQVQKR